MTHYKTPGSTPDAAPIESGGASSNRKLDWIREALCIQDTKIAAFGTSLESVTNSINADVKGEAERAAKLAVIETNVSHIRDGITEIKGAQITEAALRSLHTEMLDKQHKQHVEILDRMSTIQKELTAQVVEAKEKAYEDLRQHEERARTGRRWIIGILITVGVSVLGLAVASVFSYMRLKGG